MTDGSDKAQMIARAAARAQIDVGVLEALLALETDFTDFNLQGAKTAFTMRVAEILERAAGGEDAAR